MDAVSGAANIPEEKMTFLRNSLGGNQKAIRSDADRERAAAVLQAYENIILQRNAGRPIQQFTNVAPPEIAQPVVGFGDLRQAEARLLKQSKRLARHQFNGNMQQLQEQLSRTPEINDAINRIIAAKKAEGGGKLTPEQEAGLTEKGLSQFIDIINSRVQER